MQKTYVVGNFLFPADEQTPGAVEPRMSAFDFPTPGFAAMFRRRGLVDLARDMWRIASLANFTINRLAHIAFVEAKMLRLAGRGLGARNRDGVERGGDE